MVTRFKTFKEETQNFYKFDDLAEVVITTMGLDMWDTMQILKGIDVENACGDTPSPITYIEDGIFSSQIEESGLIEELVKMVLADLDSQGFIKKNKNLDKFTYPECCYSEIIDEKLSPGIIAYFERS